MTQASEIARFTSKLRDYYTLTKPEVNLLILTNQALPGVAVGYAPATLYSAGLTPVVVAQGSMKLENPDGIVIANSTGRIVLANTQAEKLFGYSSGELRGQHESERDESRAGYPQDRWPDHARALAH